MRRGMPTTTLLARRKGMIPAMGVVEQAILSRIVPTPIRLL